MKQSREFRTTEDDRKQALQGLISSLEQQKRLKLDELKSQAAEIDKQIAELKVLN